MVHGTVPAIIFTREDGLRLWVLLTVSLWKKVRKLSVGLWVAAPERGIRQRKCWWSGENLVSRAELIIMECFLQQLPWYEKHGTSHALHKWQTQTLRVKFGFIPWLLLAYFTGQVWTEAKEIRSNFTYNLSWYRAITVITNVSLNGERNVDNSKVSNNELVNCPDEIELHLLLQMWFRVLFSWHLSFWFLKGFGRSQCLINCDCGSLKTFPSWQMTEYDWPFIFQLHVNECAA